MNNKIPIETLHLFPMLNNMLIELLRSLKDEEWHNKTIAKLWSVKDVASHLLDGNLKIISMSRDGYWGNQPQSVISYEDLVNFINQQNMEWTNATKRISPEVLTSLLEYTGKEYIEHLNSLNPYDDAIFSVAWSGQKKSPNWFHIAREYTEKFLHQQQIREAVGKPGIMTKMLFYPFLDTMMFAFPHTFRNVAAEKGTVISLIVTSEIGGIWSIVRRDNDWILVKDEKLKAKSQVIIDPDFAWKLFSKSRRPEHVINNVEIIGDRSLGENALNIVGFMA